MRDALLFVFLLFLFSMPIFAQVYPDWIEEYFKDSQTPAGPGFGYCAADADCSVYNSDEGGCLAIIYWQPLKKVIEDGKVYYVPNNEDWRLVKSRDTNDPLYPYVSDRWYSDYISISRFKFACVEHKCVLDREASVFEMKRCQYGCDIWLNRCLCMPRDLYEFRCSDDFSKIEGLTLRWTCEEQWIVWTDCSEYGLKCGEDPRHPGYLACVEK